MFVRKLSQVGLPTRQLTDTATPLAKREKTQCPRQRNHARVEWPAVHAASFLAPVDPGVSLTVQPLVTSGLYFRSIAASMSSVIWSRSNRCLHFQSARALESSMLWGHVAAISCLKSGLYSTCMLPLASMKRQHPQLHQACQNSHKHIRCNPHRQQASMARPLTAPCSSSEGRDTMCLQNVSVISHTQPTALLPYQS